MTSILQWTDYAVVEKPSLTTWMKGGLDYIVLKSLDTDGIRIISSVLGQSIALDHYIRQVSKLSRVNDLLHGAGVIKSCLKVLNLNTNFDRLMIWLKNSLKLIVLWRRLATSPCKERSSFNLWARLIPILRMSSSDLVFLTGLSWTLKHYICL